MFIENRNKKWQEKLDEMNQVPIDFHFQQQAVWNKLEDSIQNKRVKISLPIWIRYAAAIVIVAMISTWFFYSNTPSSNEIIKNIVNNNKAEKHAIKKEIKNPTTHHPTKIIYGFVKTTNNNLPATQSNLNVEQAINAAATTSTTAAFEATATTTTTTTATTVTETETRTPIAQNKKNTPKRLPVIHINEIGREVPPVYAITNNKHATIVEKEEPILNVENTKTWWWPKSKPVTTPINTLTDNQ